MFRRLFDRVFGAPGPDYIRFGFSHQDTLARLSALVGVLIDARTTGEWPSDAEWVSLLGEDACSKLWQPTVAEQREEHAKWRVSSPRERQRMKARWTAEALLDALRNGEYTLLGVRVERASLARLEFRPDAYPYGGDEALSELVRVCGGELK